MNKIGPQLRAIRGFIKAPIKRTVAPQLTSIARKVGAGVSALGTKEGRGMIKGPAKGGAIGGVGRAIRKVSDPSSAARPSEIRTMPLNAPRSMPLNAAKRMPLKSSGTILPKKILSQPSRVKQVQGFMK